MAHSYDPKCPDCVPAIVDSKTGKVLPSDDPMMKNAMRVWWEAPIEERAAFIEVTTNNNQDEHLLELARGLVAKMTWATLH